MIPLSVVYVGLGAVALALVVASAFQGGSLRVFFLLTLRLAIGWHFLFEGLHKLHSHYLGPTETNRPFSSAPYFRTATGPLGPWMRRFYENPEQVIAERVRVTTSLEPSAFSDLPIEEQARACPIAVAQEMEGWLTEIEQAVQQQAQRELAAADREQAEGEAKAKDAASQAQLRQRVEQMRQAAVHKQQHYGTIARERLVAAQAAYARWVHGVDPRPVRLKFFSGDTVLLTAPQRLAYLEQLQQQLQQAEHQLRLGLGNGYGIEQKRVAELRNDYYTTLAELAQDAENFLVELRKDLLGQTATSDKTVSSVRGAWLDLLTIWFLIAVGTLLLVGLLTPLACLGAIGFLTLTYLVHPPFPWLPLPPNTEGNPIFINKNVIEALALCVILVHPTGRWLGLDALLARWCCRRCSTPSTPSN
jgi:uncharacterized membrane protein YphA (DoxX/SURF4 family)